MELTGIEICVGGRWKFVGKAGLCPRNPVLPDLQRVPIFYREVPWKDLYSFQTESISVDADCWDWAVDNGVEAMVIFCKDTGEIIVASKRAMTKAQKVDLGERPQYRLRRGNYKIFPSASGINIGFTSRVERVEARKLPALLEDGLDLFSAI